MMRSQHLPSSCLLTNIFPRMNSWGQLLSRIIYLARPPACKWMPEISKTTIDGTVDDLLDLLAKSALTMLSSSLTWTIYRCWYLLSDKIKQIRNVKSAGTKMKRTRRKKKMSHHIRHSNIMTKMMRGLFSIDHRISKMIWLKLPHLDRYHWYNKIQTKERSRNQES